MNNLRTIIRNQIVKQLLSEGASLNFYDFKKATKNAAAKLGFFIDNAVITGDATVTVDFHASNSLDKVKTYQYYSILSRMHYEYGLERPTVYHLLKNKEYVNKLQLIDNGGKDFLFQKPSFQYVSGHELNNLDVVLKDFSEKMVSLTLHNSLENKMELFMKELFMKEQKRILGKLIQDSYESIDTTLTLVNDKYFVDVTYKIRLDKVKLMIVGELVIEFMQDKKPSTFQFTTIQELQSIMGTVFSMLKVEKFF